MIRNLLDVILFVYPADSSVRMATASKILTAVIPMRQRSWHEGKQKHAGITFPDNN